MHHRDISRAKFQLWQSWQGLAGSCLICALCSVSCMDSAQSNRQGDDRVDPFDQSMIPALLRDRGTPIGQNSQFPEDLQEDAGTVLSHDEIVFTDPDAEDSQAIIPELQELLSAAPTEGPWKKSHTETLRDARRTNKPVLIWFTDSQNSPNCRMLQEDLFNRQDFEAWAQETFVRLQVDRHVGNAASDDLSARQADYIEHLKNHYNVLGQPTLLVLAPSGEVIGRYKGYRRGLADYRWGQLKQAAEIASKKHDAWLKKMKKKGYRHWSDPNGRTIFARLMRYHRGKLLLIEPDGTRFQTNEKHLSKSDRDWIREQKRQRGMDVTTSD